MGLHGLLQGQFSFYVEEVLKFGSQQFRLPSNVLTRSSPVVVLNLFKLVNNQ
jgi:hypothetical protein